jgi:hypothetical protein
MKGDDEDWQSEVSAELGEAFGVDRTLADIRPPGWLTPHWTESLRAARRCSAHRLMIATCLSDQPRAERLSRHELFKQY